MTSQGKPPSPVRCVVTCERCSQAVGVIHTLADLSGVSADVVTTIWPELLPAVRRHTDACLPQ